MNTTIDRIRLLAGAAGLALAATLATAQDRTLQGAIDQPLEVRAGSHVTITESADGDTWTLTMSGDSIKVTHNDEQIPADRVRRRKDKVEVLDADGKVIKTFGVGADGNTMVLGQGARRGRAPGGMTFRAMPAMPEPPQIVQMEKPKVMVGVRMSDDEGEVVVDDVIEGLPASKAGVEVGDVLVSIGDHKIVTNMDVRTALKDRNPGDTVELVIRRNGEQKTLALVLSAYDGERIGAGPWTQVAPEGRAWSAWTRSDEDRWVEQAKKHVEQAIEQIRKSDALNSEKMKATVEKTMREALDALNKVGSTTQDLLQEFSLRPGQDGVVLFGPQGRTQRFVVPGHGLQPDADTDSKLDRLSEQLDRMTARLDELQRRLEKLDQGR